MSTPSQLLLEEVSAKGLTLYHRTGAHDERFHLTSDPNGFQTKTDVFYGPGVYGSLLEKDMNTQHMVQKYGRVLIESKVTSLQGVLIFVPQISRLVYGREVSLADQLRRIFQKTSSQLRQQSSQGSPDARAAQPVFDQDLATLHTMLADHGPSYAAQGLRTACPSLQGGLKGIITQDPDYGLLGVIHNAHTVIPLRYQIGTGPWQNAGGTKQFYLKVKEFYDQKAKTFSASEPLRAYPKALGYDQPETQPEPRRYK